MRIIDCDQFNLLFIIHCLTRRIKNKARTVYLKDIQKTVMSKIGYLPISKSSNRIIVHIIS